MERAYKSLMPPSAPLPADLITRLAFAVERFGGGRVAAAIGLSKQTVYRGIAGYGIHGGNRTLMEARIGDAEALKGGRRGAKVLP